MDATRDDRALRFQSVLTEIRSLPGHEAFATGVVAGDLLAAVDDDWPVIYVDPTPFGTLLVALRRIDGTLDVETISSKVTALDAGELAGGSDRGFRRSVALALRR